MIRTLTLVSVLLSSSIAVGENIIVKDQRELCDVLIKLQQIEVEKAFTEAKEGDVNVDRIVGYLESTYILGTGKGLMFWGSPQFFVKTWFDKSITLEERKTKLLNSCYESPMLKMK